MSWVYRRPFDYRPSQRLGHGFRVLAYAAGAIAGSASLSFGDAADLGGTGELAGAPAITLTASGIPLAGSPNAIEGVGALVFGQNASLTGAGALVGTADNVLDSTGTLAGTNSYQQFMWAKKRRRDDIPFDYYAWDRIRWTIFPYSVSTATAGIGSIALGADGLLRGTSAAAGTSASILSASGTLLAGGGLAASVPLTFGVGTAELLNGASGAITAGQSFEFSATGTLDGTGALYGPADIAFDGAATYTIVNPPSGTVPLVLTATGRLINASEGAGVITAMSFSSTDPLQMFFSA